MTLNELARQIALDFKQTCNREPQWIVAAPGRVNVIGEHTDYNDGFVLPMAIDRYTLIAAAPNGTTQITLRSSAGQGQARVDLTSPLQPGTKGDWANYPLGVIAGFLARGLRPPGFDALIHSTVPLGGGLSSSAALEVATATLLEVITGQKLDPVEKALLCQKAEHDYAGVPCGIMDQFISVMGKENHLLLLDCRSRRPELVPMSDSSVALLIVNTNVKHELTGGGYAQRRAQCEQAAQILGVPSLRDATEDLLQAARSRMDDVVFRRARHVIGEIQRTVQAAAEVRASNWPVVGQLMYASHASLRDDYEVSCAELDVVVDIGRAIGPAGGVMGCRMTGGGFGGCAVALVRADQMAAISQRLAAEYEQRTNIKPTLFVSRPAAGAMVLKP
ncbi:MAG: galactokinase [Verrucomicrobia bacterium]|nr:galactokinase [Verrucomicrobiota bacterium]OQC27210.1 MAG: Galactokinase [Verrucomicrobia bacterium ADurb.Bin063]HOC49468.1 galactokinase [Verrucomicrobiota bacterium]HOX61239.1 galactokinase [Verrucomicrobiota bacterium]HPI63742.1 galactokinase [Verrucomicrobiota bacterium]